MPRACDVKQLLSARKMLCIECSSNVEKASVYKTFHRTSCVPNFLVQLIVNNFLCLVVLTLAIITSHAHADIQDLHAPCMGCRLFNLEHRLHPEVNKTDTVFCHYPCQCPIEVLSCHEGVGVIKDGCGCCYMCARQRGDLCTVRDLCDVSKGLYCDRDKSDDSSVGHCLVKVKKRSCNVQGVTYDDGEKFQPKCSQLCTCQNGFYGCVSTCPQEQQKPSELTCHEPKLIKVKNKCCREWTCQKIEADSESRLAELPGLESQNLVVQNPQWIRTTTTPAPPTTTTSYPLTCHAQSTDWSPCSVTCDVGVAIKIVVDPITCQQAQEQRLCYIRPCGLNVTTHGRDKCTPTTRSDSHVHIRYQDCISVREYRIKFCTNCRANYCCYPRKTRTTDMEFQCSGGIRKTFNYTRIKKCRCSKVCYQKGPREARSRVSRHVWLRKKKERRLRRRERKRSRRENRRRFMERQRRKRRFLFE